MSAHAGAGRQYVAPRDVWLHAFINLSGFAVLIGTAYAVGWFKEPWRERPSVREHRGKAGFWRRAPHGGRMSG